DHRLGDEQYSRASKTSQPPDRLVQIGWRAKLRFCSIKTCSVSSSIQDKELQWEHIQLKSSRWSREKRIQRARNSRRGVEIENGLERLKAVLHLLVQRRPRLARIPQLPGVSVGIIIPELMVVRHHEVWGSCEKLTEKRIGPLVCVFLPRVRSLSDKQTVWREI